MKTAIIIIVCLAVGFGLGQVIPHPGTGETQTVTVTKQLYTCGMHPEIISDEPGFCPICGMKLTPKKDGGQAEGSIMIDPTTRHNMGVETTPVTNRQMIRSIRAFGRVAVPDPNRYTVNVKISGWVEKLFVDEEGAYVHRGEPLLEIYSPALVAAQREYLVARKAMTKGGGDEMRLFAKTSEERLRNWDISDEQIAALESDGEVTRTLTIYSPTDGYVIHKTVDVGDQISPMKALYHIADVSTVWVTAHVYESDVPFVSVGAKAVVQSPSIPAKTFTSKVIYVSPTLDPKSQLEIRLAIANPDLMLRPDMYAEVVIEAALSGNRPAIPRSAVIHSGVREVVYVERDDHSFDPREVITGVVDDEDMVEIRGGLQIGERVVVSGQFMLDSESRLGEAVGTGHQHGGMEGMTDMSSSHSDHGKDVMADMSSSKDPYDIHTCPMPEHFHVLNYGPGECPECGMKLVPVAETKNTEVYVCTMPQCGVVQNTPGTCPVCSMKLVLHDRGKHNDK